MRSRRLRRVPQHPITRKLRGQAARAHVGLQHPEGTAVDDIGSRFGSRAGACAERPRALAGGPGWSSEFDGVSFRFSGWFRESDRQFPGQETRFRLWKHGFGDSASARGIRSLKPETARAAGEPPPSAGQETLPEVGDQGPASGAPLKKMTQDQPLLAVQEALRKCFPVVEEQQGLWQSSLRDCQPLLASLSNLAEQLQAAQNLRFEDVPPLRAFPDLKERLRRKQLAAGDTVLDKLGERLAALLQVRDTVSRHVEQVLEVYDQRAGSIGVDAVLQASAVSPSVADMLEWLQDIERHYRDSYLKRKYLLSSIQWGDLANIQALPKAWDQISEDEHQSLVQDTLLNVSFFLEE